MRRLRLELPPFTCEAWLENLVAVPSESSEALGIQLVCPTAFHRDRVRDLYLARIHSALEAAAGQPVEVRFDVGTVEDAPDAVSGAPGGAPAGRDGADRERPGKERGEAGAGGAGQAPAVAPQPNRDAKPLVAAGAPTTRADAPRPEPTAARAEEKHRPYQPVQQTFGSFVVGECNSLAREASLAVVRETGPGLSQLYLCSESGLGKTHLSRAVFCEARANGRRPVYTSAEAFTNEFLASLRSHQMDRFKRKFRRDCDVLVIEDVHFLEGKESTQLEFFHSVGHVLDAGGRVVMTGNRLPSALTALDPRVRSQVAAGFVCELGPPDARVRRNILRAKAAAGGVRLPDECLELLVESVRGNVRDLEGVLIQLVTTASLLKRPIDPALTREALEKKGAVRADAAPAKLAPADVIAVVASFFKTTLDVMSSKSRRRDVLLPRQLAMYLCNEYTEASLAEIGRALGRDHPSVRNAITKVERSLLESVPLRYQVEALIERLDELARARP